MSILLHLLVIAFMLKGRVKELWERRYGPAKLKIFTLQPLLKKFADQCSKRKSFRIIIVRFKFNKTYRNCAFFLQLSQSVQLIWGEEDRIGSWGHESKNSPEGHQRSLWLLTGAGAQIANLLRIIWHKLQGKPGAFRALWESSVCFTDFEQMSSHQDFKAHKVWGGLQIHLKGRS